MREKVAKLGNNEPIASPSRPSVKLTALLQPTMIKTTQGMKNSPKFGVKCLKNGKITSVPQKPQKTSRKAEIVAIMTWILNLTPAEIPLCSRILCQSSQKPTMPYPNVQKIKIQTLILVKSHHKRILISIIAKINTPPMVGILSFFLCVSGVNSRALDRKKRREMAIKRGPKSKKVAKEESKE